MDTEIVDLRKAVYLRYFEVSYCTYDYNVFGEV